MAEVSMDEPILAGREGGRNIPGEGSKLDMCVLITELQGQG